jgi:4-aminobutyrate aminotransferase-like enzyme/Ser/Thr protein kinase RdoA (MazF antagonist)
VTDLLESPIPAVPDDTIARIGREVFGLEGPFEHLGGERDLNILFDDPTGRFVLKVANPAEPAAVIEMQAAVLEHLAVVDPELSVPRLRRSAGGRPTEPVVIEGVEHVIRLVTYLDGDLPVAPAGPEYCASMGSMLGRLQVSLGGFFHPAAGRRLLWDARACGDLVPWTGQIESPALRRLVHDVLAGFASRADEMRRLPAQVIHNDFHFGNVLASGSDVVGVIDFGDMIHGTRVQDLSVAVAYGVLGLADPLSSACRIVNSFLERVALGPAEVAALDELVLVRLAQSIAIGAHRSALHPENVDYIAADTPMITDLLDRWVRIERTEVREAFMSVAGLPPQPVSTDVLTRRRRMVFSSLLATTYDSPLHLVSGDGVWLTAADGSRYLDAYNNVVQVGHAHPRVVRAIAAQSTALNTNTRYLTDRIVTYAERLGALLPGDLGVCFFVNSGTEANDLAWRMAKAVSGNSAVIITAHAYHGWTDAVMAMSPEEHDGAPLAPWVAAIRPPEAGTDIEGSIAAALGRLEANGHDPAAAIIDSAFSSDGIFDAPTGYHAAVARAVRSRGGLFIADEVQAGMGRVGRRFWGFAVDDFVPDIVTLGKPIGNGFPMGAVITTPEIAERFASKAYFFSTFGGNPVAAAAGQAVLDVTLGDELASRAETVGRGLRRDLGAILAEKGMGARVRGAGMFTGVDLGDAALAHRIVEGMKDRGILISATGPSNTVLKIRPPLVFDHGNAATLVEGFEGVLGSV